MAIKPGPIDITIGSFTVKADSLTTTYEDVPFDRVEFAHDKLKTAPLQTGVAPIIGQLLGNVPYEIVIDCALTGSGFVGGASSYIPRPVVPDNIPSDTDNIKQRISIIRFKVTSQGPESASPGIIVDNIFNSYLIAHKNMLAQFTNRLAIFNTPIAYEQLLAAQTDNIQALYFATGISFSGAEYSGLSDIMVTDGQINEEFVIPDGMGGFIIYKTFDLILEQRTVLPASSP